ncbi:hypothetical protein VP01_140g1 [Puccinia sorghi]|uniref:Uncharacterized protein n=1 Tax=Puccinia sorghi TaxID=27349 RepID=A0A0L6VKU3_9BASI|nr:hypothetical protein VP01_140g1 [Puccinia sorghi]
MEWTVNLGSFNKRETCETVDPLAAIPPTTAFSLHKQGYQYTQFVIAQSSQWSSSGLSILMNSQTAEAAVYLSSKQGFAPTGFWGLSRAKKHAKNLLPGTVQYMRCGMIVLCACYFQAHPVLIKQNSVKIFNLRPEPLKSPRIPRSLTLRSFSHSPVVVIESQMGLQDHNRISKVKMIAPLQHGLSVKLISIYSSNILKYIKSSINSCLFSFSAFLICFIPNLLNSPSYHIFLIFLRLSFNPLHLSFLTIMSSIFIFISELCGVFCLIFFVLLSFFSSDLFFLLSVCCPIWLVVQGVEIGGHLGVWGCGNSMGEGSVMELRGRRKLWVCGLEGSEGNPSRTQGKTFRISFRVSKATSGEREFLLEELTEIYREELSILQQMIFLCVVILSTPSIDQMRIINTERVRAYKCGDLQSYRGVWNMFMTGVGHFNINIYSSQKYVFINKKKISELNIGQQDPLSEMYSINILKIDF